MHSFRRDLPHDRNFTYLQNYPVHSRDCLLLAHIVAVVFPLCSSVGRLQMAKFLMLENS